MSINENIQALLPNADSTKITILVSLAENYISNYCDVEYSSDMDSIVVLMVLEDYSKLGSDGITSRSANGISEAYMTDYSPKVISLLNKYRNKKVKIY